MAMTESSNTHGFFPEQIAPDFQFLLGFQSEKTNIA